MENNTNPAPAENTAPVATADAEKNRWVAVLAYFIFFIPLLVDKDSEFGKFHANQGLNVLIAGLVVGIVGTVIPIIGWFLILPIGALIVTVLAIIGIVNAASLKMKELPIIGGIKIIK